MKTILLSQVVLMAIVMVLAVIVVTVNVVRGVINNLYAVAAAGMLLYLCWYLLKNAVREYREECIKGEESHADNRLRG